MQIIAVVGYTLGLVFEVAGIALLVRRARQVRSSHKSELGVPTFQRLHELSSPQIILHRIEAIEESSLTIGWPLRVLVAGIVFSYVGNFASLAS